MSLVSTISTERISVAVMTVMDDGVMLKNTTSLGRKGENGNLRFIGIVNDSNINDIGSSNGRNGRWCGVQKHHVISLRHVI
mmetsp:Transcript_11622/g.14520  ORF Transcript_11622/g.14520 Transcript_11622/m.14520 type:complete len:81 (+) Transcript_11622:137-379(+)